MADFQRRKHGQISKERLLSWIEKKDKLGMGYSTIDIPNRLLQMIGNIAGSHSASLDTVMGLETVDTGFANDYVHPRFLAVLLQLGDALDMDNGRFHPLTKEYLGQLPESSEVHFRKHKAIQRLFISNQKIQIEADCEKQEELRLIRSECNWIRKLLERAAAAWSEIRPEGSSVALPTFDTPHLKYRGLDIPDNLVEAKFLISQKRAFELIKGSNIYRDRYVFLRELIQNAVDATKLQYFRTVLRKGRLEKGEAANCSPAEMAAIVRPDGYPIEVTLSLAKGKNGVGQVLLREEEAERGTDEEIGVLIQVRDYGTGISQSDIAQIGRVGTSYESRKAEIDSMPKWLKPTGMFGIGLQSIFLLTGKFRATTHTRQEEDYDITFYSHHGNDGGYINVTPGQDEEEHLRAYGTCFEVFIPNSRLHPSGFAEDIFNSAYLEQEELALARQVMMEMAEYLSNLFVNALFPLTLELRDVGVRDQETQEQHYKGLQDRAFQAMQFQLPFFGKNGWGFPQTVSKRPLFWAYQIDKPEELYHDEKGNVCRLDVKEGRLYIFNGSITFFVGYEIP